MEFKDYYKILAVTPEADSKAIKTAYRKLARKYHPDVSAHREAEEKFKEISGHFNHLTEMLMTSQEIQMDMRFESFSGN